MDDKHKPVYSIGEASKKLGVIVPLLRMLEKSDLLLTARNEHGKRLYSECDLDYIRALIETGKRKNASIEDFQQSFADLKCWEILECPPERRDICPHYASLGTPCWANKEKMCDEDYETCRDCPVYRSLTELIAS